MGLWTGLWTGLAWVQHEYLGIRIIIYGLYVYH